jgi:hypothetical protein
MQQWGEEEEGSIEVGEANKAFDGQSLEHP